jgi:hypothetical protein
LASYWLQAIWGWHDIVETCSSVIISEIIVHLLVIVQNTCVTSYWLQAIWGWHDLVEPCRSVIVCEIIVHFLVIVQNKNNTVSLPWPPEPADGKINSLPSDQSFGSSVLLQTQTWLPTQRQIAAGRGYPEDSHKQSYSTSDGVLLGVVRVHVTSSFRAPRHVASFNGVVTHILVICNSVLTRITSKNHAYISLITLPLLAAGWSAAHNNMSAFYWPLTLGAHGTTSRHNSV